MKLAGRYRLLNPLGDGPVRLAFDEEAHRDVAIRDMRTLPADAVRRALDLRHPSIVPMLDVVEEGGPWLVMEFVSGASLEQTVGSRHPLPELQAARVGVCLLSALTAAHEAGIVHGNVNPGKILLTSTGRAVLTGFCLPHPGLQPAADLWSLAATLHFAIEGRPPGHAPAADQEPLRDLIRAMLDPAGPPPLDVITTTLTRLALNHPITPGPHFPPAYTAHPAPDLPPPAHPEQPAPDLPPPAYPAQPAPDLPPPAYPAQPAPDLPPPAYPAQPAPDLPPAYTEQPTPDLPLPAPPHIEQPTPGPPAPAPPYAEQPAPGPWAPAPVYAAQPAPPPVHAAHLEYGAQPTAPPVIGAQSIAPPVIGVQPTAPPAPAFAAQPPPAEADAREERPAKGLRRMLRRRRDDTAPAPEPQPQEPAQDRPLDQVIGATGPLPAAQVASIGLAVLDQLVALHARGEHHGDVRPGSILLAPSGQAILAPPLMPTGISTYTAPEGSTGPAADLWSLGATLFAAVEGLPPSPGAPLTRAGTLAPVLFGLLSGTPADRPAPHALRGDLLAIAQG